MLEEVHIQKRMLNVPLKPTGVFAFIPKRDVGGCSCPAAADLKGQKSTSYIPGLQPPPIPSNIRDIYQLTSQLI